MSQPRHGFRAGLDSVLLGAAVGQGRRKLLDLGCGVGTAGLVAMAHEPALTAVLADQNTEMLALATNNVAENGFADRVRVIEADVTARGSDRHTAGLADNAFDVIIANPPFFAEHAGTLAADTGRAGARHMDSAALDLWVKTAAGCASGGGEIIFVYPVESLSPLLASFTKRFGAVTILPLTPRPDAPVTRVLMRGIKGSRAPLTLLVSRPLHGLDGRAFHPDFDAIFRGAARLVW